MFPFLDDFKQFAESCVMDPGSAAHKRNQDWAAKCRKSWQDLDNPSSPSLSHDACSGSLDVGERSAQKIKIGEPSAENPSKGVEFSYARQGAWHVGELAKMPQIWELGRRGAQRTKDQDWGAKYRKSRQGCRVLLRTSGSLARRGACQNSANLGATKSATGLQ